MYSVTVRDHIMVAHSLRGAVFGPAQRLHGATYIVDFELHAAQLDANGIVVDIGLAIELLHAVLQPLKYMNLDDMPELRGLNTTTEVLTRYIFDRLKDRLVAHPQVVVGAQGLQAMRITLTESPQAWVTYTGSLSETTESASV